MYVIVYHYLLMGFDTLVGQDLHLCLCPLNTTCCLRVLKALLHGSLVHFWRYNQHRLLSANPSETLRHIKLQLCVDSIFPFPFRMYPYVPPNSAPVNIPCHLP